MIKSFQSPVDTPQQKAVKTPVEGLNPPEAGSPPAALSPEVQKASQQEGSVAEDAVGGAPRPPSSTGTQGQLQHSHAGFSSLQFGPTVAGGYSLMFSKSSQIQPTWNRWFWKRRLNTPLVPQTTCSRRGNTRTKRKSDYFSLSSFFFF